MKLEPANIVCPKCGSPNYMRHLIGKGVGKLDMKCINCNSYFNFDELYKQKIAEYLKPEPKTNADRIRTMTDEELADWVTLMVCKHRSCGNCPMSDWCTPGRGIADWIKSPVEVDNG